MRKPLPSDWPSERPEHHAAFLAAVIDERLRALAVARDDRRHGVGALLRLGGIEARSPAPRPRCRPRGASPRRAGGGGETRLQPFGEDHVERGAQREQQVLRRRAAIFVVMRLALAEGPVPIGRAQVGGLVRFARARPGGGEAEAGRRHQALLRARHRDVHAPGVHLERHAAERGDGIDHQQRVMAGRAHRLADRLDVVDDARRGVDLRHQDRLDLALARPPSAAPRPPPASRRGGSRPAGSRPRSRASSAASPQPIAKRPLSSTSTLSPRDSTLVSAASQAPWPFAA